MFTGEDSLDKFDQFNYIQLCKASNREVTFEGLYEYSIQSLPYEMQQAAKNPDSAIASLLTCMCRTMIGMNDMYREQLKQLQVVGVDYGELEKRVLAQNIKLD